MRAIGVIPARGGSKGVPRKNIIPLLGKPLIAYTIKAAQACRLITDVVVSTDDKEIAQVCQNLGAQVPFMRPAELATDTATSLSVIQHTVREMEVRLGQVYDLIVYLQPTTPLRTAMDIDNGIQLLLDAGADSVVSVVDVGAYHPLRMKRIAKDNVLLNYIDQGYEDMRPRQQLPPVYIRSGDLYISRREVNMEENRMIGEDCRAYVIPSDRSVNIDTEFDLILADYLLKKYSEHVGS